jgi:hypothetical protein
MTLRDSSQAPTSVYIGHQTCHMTGDWQRHQIDYRHLQRPRVGTIIYKAVWKDPAAHIMCTTIVLPRGRVVSTWIAEIEDAVVGEHF